MAQAKIFEGTWDELLVRAEEFRKFPRLTLSGHEALPLYTRIHSLWFRYDCGKFRTDAYKMPDV